MSPPLHTVDVFTDKKYTGNQLAVVRHAHDIDDDSMQAIAKEMNYSETTFIRSDTPSDNAYDVRIFTPEAELPFAGHPTLGTAFVIQQEIIREQVERVTLNLHIGPIPVEFTYADGQPDALWMTQNQPEFGVTVPPGNLVDLLGLSPDAFDDRYPIQAVSTGIPALIIPLESLQHVKDAKVNVAKYFELVDNIEPKLLLIFAPDTYEERNDLNVRVFVDYFGIPEDPATGSANGCLAAWLAKYKYFGDSRVSASVEQGYEIKRPSNLLLRAQADNGGFNIQVGGRVVTITRGELL